MDYNFKEIEAVWQQYWKENKTFKALNISQKPKYYVLDMFPYPSGAGLHVGHPLGYIASDIFARYKRHRGFNVLHPMGFDAYGLPAEQYAIQTGQHPAVTTQENLARYKEQLSRLGFSFDWDREVQTCDPNYVKWTQWVFIKLFESWYDKKQGKAQPIEELIKSFEKEGNVDMLKQASCSMHDLFSAQEWLDFNQAQKSEILMHYRLAYLCDTNVNWCPQLGTVLANDEVINGRSQRGGYLVEKKKMRQWSLRMTAYASRLLEGLDKLDWTESIKTTQRNWIGKSKGASIFFPLENKDGDQKTGSLEVFTTRPDTIFGVSFMVICPEHEQMQALTSPEQKLELKAYLALVKNKSERERMTDVLKVSGVFTGSYALHPFTQERIPIYVADYVLSGYGTGAIMAVAAHDQRDYRFAKHFNLPIKQVVAGGDIGEQAFESKEGKLMNSDFLNGLDVKQAIEKMGEKLEQMGIGTLKTIFRLRDAIFSRQRYWGEPFPIYYKEGIAYALPESELPLNLPPVDAYLPTEDGQPPLARAQNWTSKQGYPLEVNTMPGFAGSSAYYLRYMDAGNDKELVSKEANQYWGNVDLYMGGSEHATGHLLYARFWNFFLYDLGLTIKAEPFQRMINQGMIQGRSNFVYRLNYDNYLAFLESHKDFKALGAYKREDANLLADKHLYVSANIEFREEFCDPVHVDINIVENDILDVQAFKAWMPHLADAEFILENDKYHCGWEVEKMSKSMYNVQNPDQIIEKYGADTLRMYEMFLGPIEQSKPWDTQGIEGVHRFLRKFWRLFYSSEGEGISASGPGLAESGTGAESAQKTEHREPAFYLDPSPATKAELKVLHRCIQKIDQDMERFSFNTSVSSFMICVNELGELKCRKKEILEPLTIMLSAFAPHICEHLYQQMGYQQSIETALWPVFEEKWIEENSINYPVSFNGKTRFQKEYPKDMKPKDIELDVLALEESQKWLEGKTVKKIIVVPGRIINIVV